MPEFAIVRDETEHEYFVEVGNIRGDTPQDVRDHAIDMAVNDVPDIAARYDVVPGYIVRLWDQGRSMDFHGTGRMVGLSMLVRVSVSAGRASWTAPEDPDKVRRG